MISRISPRETATVALDLLVQGREWIGHVRRSAGGAECVVSCTRGMPNTAITASPMCFSTVPSWRSIALRIASKYRDYTSRSDSGSKPRRAPSSQ